MYIKNSVGPRTEPCGTPEVTSNSKENFLSITTFCFFMCQHNLEFSLPVVDVFLVLVLIFTLVRHEALHQKPS